jgi:hypothetical protein
MKGRVDSNPNLVKVSEEVFTARKLEGKLDYEILVLMPNNVSWFGFKTSLINLIYLKQLQFCNACLLPIIKKHNPNLIF